MSVTEILLELPRLDAQARSRIFQRLCELQEQDLLQGEGPTPEEKELLRKELIDFERDRDKGAPWRDVVARLTSTESR